MHNVMEKMYAFLGYYEQKLGYDFSETKQWLLTVDDEAIVKKAYDKSQLTENTKSGAFVRVYDNVNSGQVGGYDEFKL